MSRIVSFVVLIAILVVIAALFFRVMAGFLLPMFLAVLLAIMFGPLHDWFIEKCKGRDRVAAGLTAGSILLILLIPLMAILIPAIYQGKELYDQEMKAQASPTSAALKLRSELSEKVVQFGQRFGVKLSSEEIERALGEKLQEWLAPVATNVVRVLGRLVLCVVITIISLYYFLADGPKMIITIMRLSPLDDKYERQLIDEFQNITRAVVVATLLSAFVQGLLAGFGFYMAGLPWVSLLMVATMLLAMVPFVGAAAVWIPATIWLYYYEHTWAAVGLGAYGALIVSTADNVIKPLVLHGRSNLHPLLALLSVLGGVQTLGPVGIFVGPMVVVFFHALLNMLHLELDSMGQVAALLGPRQDEAAKETP